MVELRASALVRANGGLGGFSRRVAGQSQLCIASVRLGLAGSVKLIEPRIDNRSVDGAERDRSGAGGLDGSQRIGPFGRLSELQVTVFFGDENVPFGSDRQAARFEKVAVHGQRLAHAANCTVDRQNLDEVAFDARVRVFILDAVRSVQENISAGGRDLPHAETGWTGLANDIDSDIAPCGDVQRPHVPFDRDADIAIGRDCGTGSEDGR